MNGRNFKWWLTCALLVITTDLAQTVFYATQGKKSYAALMGVMSAVMIGFAVYAVIDYRMKRKKPS